MTAHVAAAFALLVLLVACSAGAPRDLPDNQMAGAPGCFNIRDVQDFRALDRNRLVVFAPNDSRAYQVRISPPSSALRGASRIAFESRSGRICGRAGDSLYFDRPGAMRFAVTDVRRLDRNAVGMLGDAGGPDAEGLEPETDTAADIEPLPGAGGDQADEQLNSGEL